MAFIAIIGIPGCGKSSLARSLSAKFDITSFCEPEEQHWPEAVSMSYITGSFTSVSWFRSMRVPSLYKAKRLSDSGKNCIVDSYFDKLMYKYMDKEGLNWFISPSDPYYDLIYNMSKKDYKELPNADIVIALRITEELWGKFLQSRGRQVDKSLLFKENCFRLQDHMLAAAKTYAEKFKKEYLEIQQDEFCFNATLEKSLLELKKLGIKLNKK